MESSLQAKILDIHHSAVYLAQVYTQDVVLAVQGGPEIEVYDDSRYVTPDMVETTRAVELRPYVSVVTPSPTEERHITRDREGQPVFQGRVVDLDSGDDPANGVLDVGVGSIRFCPREVDRRVAVGDYLRITRASIGLHDIEGRRDPEEKYAFFLDRLRNGHEEHRQQAARYLGTVGSQRAVEDLIEVLRSESSPGVRSAAATALARLGVAAFSGSKERDPRIKAALADAADDGNQDVAEAARLGIEDIEIVDREHHRYRDW